jgi:putative two-component system response regulator
MYSAILADELGWEQAAVDDIRVAAPMHDLGKIGVPDSVLRKPGRLTAAELEVMKTHTTVGGRMLEGSDLSLLQMARDIALSHHEKWDGSGAPQGLAGAEIPMCARIVAIADVYDALVHDRVYRSALTEDEAVERMAEERGKHFDPEVYDCFARVTGQFTAIGDAVKDADPSTEPDPADARLGRAGAVVAG